MERRPRTSWPATWRRQPPTGSEPTQLGEDVFSRVIVGARDILEIAPLATLLCTAVGAALGLALGYFGGLFDMLVVPASSTPRLPFPP